MAKKLTNTQKLFQIADMLRTAKENVIVEAIDTYAFGQWVWTDGKKAQITFAPYNFHNEKSITFQFDKGKYWKGEPDLSKAHVVEVS